MDHSMTEAAYRASVDTAVDFDLSLVIACYFEGEHLQTSLLRLVDVLDASGLRYELIFVDDASKDSTPDIIREFCDGRPNCHAYFHEKNLGRGGTVTEGMRHAKGKVTGFIDIDLEVHPLYIPHMVHMILQDRCDAVVGDRVYFIAFSITTLFRAILSRGYRRLIHVFFKLPVRDTEAGYKFFNRKKILPVLNRCQDQGWFWDTEIVLRAEAAGLRLAQVPCAFVRRSDKTSTVRVVRDSWEYICALFRHFRRVRLKKEGAVLYRQPWLHRLVILALYGRKLDERFVSVAAHIDKDDSVLELCVGEGELYKRYLAGCTKQYLGLDFSEAQVERGRAAGIPLERADIRDIEFEPCDTVVMMGSLYQFLPDAKSLLERMLLAARKRVIITEPVQNVSQKKGLLSHIAVYLTETDNHGAQRFDETKLRELVQDEEILSWEEIAGGREIAVVLRGRAQ